MLAKIGALLTNPYRLLYSFWAWADRNRLDQRYRRLAEQEGFRELFLVLSFDCDTREDADTVLKVHDRLSGLGVTPVYAVPGELLNKGERVYRKIADAGGEFINHGFRDHTFFDTARGRYTSCFFYDQLPLETVRNDIVEGDRNLRSTLGIQSKGFRAPHFGTFQKPPQLRFQHSVLQELGYRFSTSTLPIYAYRFGPAFRDFGVLELPVSGMGSMPLRILDSWTCFAAPARRFGPEDFVREGRLAGENFRSLGIGLLNFYADPSHIHDRPEFFEAVAYWAQIAKPVTYSQLLAELP
jgi:Polysaccharide deacetylase